MQFALQTQDALMRVEWDAELLSIPWTCEQLRPDGGLLFRGLRLAIGMCTGGFAHLHSERRGLCAFRPFC